jgi:hypothetical protein
MNFEKFVEHSTEFSEKFANFVENSTVFLYFYIFVSDPLARIFYFLHIKLEFPKKI